MIEWVRLHLQGSPKSVFENCKGAFIADGVI